jgi:hypothetical protein
LTPEEVTAFASWKRIHIYSFLSKVCCSRWIPGLQVSNLVMVSGGREVVWAWRQNCNGWRYCRESGLKDKQRDYLPQDKQFLVTRNGKPTKQKSSLCTHPIASP